MTRNDPSEFGLKDTCTCVEFTTDAVTFCPPAVIAAIAPNVCPDAPVWELSAHACARLPIAPDAAAVGDRPLHKLSVAVCRVPGLAPVTLTISSSLPAGTQACMAMPPPDSSSTPLYRSSVPVKFEADVIAARPGICNCPGDSRSGMVSLRFSCAVNPPAAHADTPSDPLPSGRNCDGELFGWPSTTSERDTTPAGLSGEGPAMPGGSEAGRGGGPGRGGHDGQWRGEQQRCRRHEPPVQSGHTASLGPPAEPGWWREAALAWVTDQRIRG